MIKISISFYNWCIENKSKLLEEWDYEKNDKLGITPHNITHGSKRKVWWKCNKGHQWQSGINNRVYGNGCPYCSGRLPIVGVTDLATTHPEIAKQWHPTKNGNLKPTDVSAGSNNRVWWICEKGHEWQRNVAYRSRGDGCPYCSGNKVLKGFNDIATTHPHLVDSWHPTKNGHLTPYSVSFGSNKNIWWICKHGHEWKTTIAERARGKGCPYCSNHRVLKGFNDLETTHPEIAKQWHLIKNGDFKPTNVTAGSSKNVWWICEHGHEWKATVASRVSGHNCPYCSNNKVLAGFNDLATTHTELAKQWHPTKNGDLKPTDVIAGSKKKVWWICEKEHIWKSSIVERAHGNGCPYCSNHKVLMGFNDLATTHPEIAKQWHPTKNGNLKPTDVTAGSGKKVWWICEHKHEWKTTIQRRTYGDGCPHCSTNSTSRIEMIILFYLSKHSNEKIKHRYRAKGFEIDIFIPSLNVGIEYDGKHYHTDVEKDLRKNKRCKKENIKLIRIREFGAPILNDPSLYKIYIHHRNKNLETIIQDIILALFNKKVKVDIKTDITKINSFISHHKKENSIETTHPHLVKEWHPTKNGNLLPKHVTYGSDLLVWWICEHGHEWQYKVGPRTMGYGCPYCSGKRVLAGFNDLATTHPKITKQWHPTKNGNLKPTDVTAGSNKKVWWICDNNHEWEAKIHNRTKTNPTGCPHCYRQKHKFSKPTP